MNEGLGELRCRKHFLAQTTSQSKFMVKKKFQDETRISCNCPVRKGLAVLSLYKRNDEIQKTMKRYKGVCKMVFCPLYRKSFVVSVGSILIIPDTVKGSIRRLYNKEDIRNDGQEHYDDAAGRRSRGHREPFG